jgi:hypothetical protein
MVFESITFQDPIEVEVDLVGRIRDSPIGTWQAQVEMTSVQKLEKKASARIFCLIQYDQSLARIGIDSGERAPEVLQPNGCWAG